MADVIPLPREDVICTLPVDRYRTEPCPSGDHIVVIDTKPHLPDPGSA